MFPRLRFAAAACVLCALPLACSTRKGASPEAGSEGGQVVAQISGKPVTLADLDAWIKDDLFKREVGDKSAADLLFHGVGMLVPQVGGAYDMAQGAVRMGAASMNSFNYGMLPQWGFNNFGIPPLYNSPFLM